MYYYSFYPKFLSAPTRILVWEIVTKSTLRKGGTNFEWAFTKICLDQCFYMSEER